MKKLIFKKFYISFISFFMGSLLTVGVIVWTIQAVNYFEFVSQDGHGLRTYIYYTLLNFPKIIHRILPFIFFISLFYTLISYENKDELNIFWINGISKKNFSKVIFFLSIFFMFIQLILGAYISPISQLAAREHLKNSNIDFFSSLIKERKFIDTAKDLTIFINKKNDDGSFEEIFIDDNREKNSRMIIAKSGLIINSPTTKYFKLYKGRIINISNSKINVFDFEQINLNLLNLNSNTITVPKIQEIDTKTLLSCFINLKANIYDVFDCSENLKNEIKGEIIKRLIKPIYIPLICMVCSFLLLNSKRKINYKKKNNLIFLVVFGILLISEVSLRYASTSNLMALIYFLIPLFLLFLSHLIFIKKVKHV